MKRFAVALLLVLVTSVPAFAAAQKEVVLSRFVVESQLYIEWMFADHANYYAPVSGWGWVQEANCLAYLKTYTAKYAGTFRCAARKMTVIFFISWQTSGAGMGAVTVMEIKNDFEKCDNAVRQARISLTAQGYHLSSEQMCSPLLPPASATWWPEALATYKALMAQKQ